MHKIKKKKKNGKLRIQIQKIKITNKKTIKKEGKE